MKSASKKPITEKLGVKSGNRIAVLHSQKGYPSIIANLPPEVSFTTKMTGEPFDLVQAFYTVASSLKEDLFKFKEAIHPHGKVWVCWKKGNVTELSRDSIAEICEKGGLEAVASCALDLEWSALKLMLPKEKRNPSAKGSSVASKNGKSC